MRGAVVVSPELLLLDMPTEGAVRLLETLFTKSPSSVQEVNINDKIQ